MNYFMKLDDAPFEATKRGKKQIEIRINTEERENIKSGDTITFENKEEILLVLVIEKRRYKNMIELTKYEDFLKTGGIYQSTEEWIQNIDSFYSREDQSVKGLLALEIRLMWISHLTNSNETNPSFMELKYYPNDDEFYEMI